MNTITSQYNEAIANTIPYLIIVVSLIFLTKMTIKYLEILLQDYNKE